MCQSSQLQFQGPRQQFKADGRVCRAEAAADAAAAQGLRIAARQQQQPHAPTQATSFPQPQPVPCLSSQPYSCHCFIPHGPSPSPSPSLTIRRAEKSPVHRADVCCRTPHPSLFGTHTPPPKSRPPTFVPVRNRCSRCTCQGAKLNCTAPPTPPPLTTGSFVYRIPGLLLGWQMPSCPPPSPSTHTHIVLDTRARATGLKA